MRSDGEPRKRWRCASSTSSILCSVSGGGHSGSLEQGGELIEESIVVGTAVEVEQFDCHVGGAVRLLDRSHSEPGEDRSACEALRELGRLLEDHPGQVIADVVGGGAAFGQKGHGRAVQLGRHGREEHVLGAGAAMAERFRDRARQLE